MEFLLNVESNVLLRKSTVNVAVAHADEIQAQAVIFQCEFNTWTIYRRLIDQRNGKAI